MILHFREPRGCMTCGARNPSKIQRAVPEGWTRIVSRRSGEVVLLCPLHRWGR